jgi:CBS domain-containing protein
MSGAPGDPHGEQGTAPKVRDRMSPDVRLAAPDQTIREAARAMAELRVGALPVAEGDRLVGMVTDRDIAVRAVAEGRGPDTPVREVMTPEVKYCFDHEDLELVARHMGDQQVRRLPVVDRDKRLVGILSLGDVAAGTGAEPACDALAGISRPGGQHS